MTIWAFLQSSKVYAVFPSGVLPLGNTAAVIPAACLHKGKEGMNEHAAVTEYSAAWNRLFVQEAPLLRRIFGDNCLRVYHIGSTAVPDLAAVPCIDMLAIVRSVDGCTIADAVFAQAGYEDKGAYGVSGRRYVRAGSDACSYQLYVFAQNDAANIDRHLMTRDYLRAHAAERAAYTALKKHCASDSALYAAQKRRFMEQLEEKARQSVRLGPDPDALYPVPGLKRICFIKNCITRPNIIAGDYSYYDDPGGAELFEEHVTHHYEFYGDSLIIGKFCAIAKGVEFIMNGANHRMCSVTTYPFNLFGGGWERTVPALADLPFKGDTVIGNDVWIGQNATIMPGVHIGDGAVIGANSTVTKDVAPYTIVGGNPARHIRNRFDSELTAYLLRLKWWDFTPYELHLHLESLCSGNLHTIQAAQSWA